MDYPSQAARTRPSPTEQPTIKHLKPSIDPSPLFYRQLLDGALWQKIPAYRDWSRGDLFSTHLAGRNTITSPQKLLQAVQTLVPAAFTTSHQGLPPAKMSIRVSP